jgi:hypothetical protein
MGEGAMIFRVLGIIAGVFSLTILAWKGFHFSFGPFLLGVLEFYENQAREFFNLFEPFIKEQLANLQAFFGWDLQLYPHWKHAFVLMWLYFGTFARATWAAGLRSLAAIVLLWGGFIAFVAGVLSGAVALDSTTSNMVMAFWPIAGVVVFALGWGALSATFDRAGGYTWLEHFWSVTLRYPVRFALFGALTLGVGTQADKIPFVQTLPSPGLALLFALLVVLVLDSLWDGAGARRGAGGTRWQKFLNDPNTRLGLDMLSVIGLASFVVLLGMAGV